MGGREGEIRSCMVVLAYTNHTMHWHVCLTMLLIHAALPMYTCRDKGADHKCSTGKGTYKYCVDYSHYTRTRQMTSCNPAHLSSG